MSFMEDLEIDQYNLEEECREQPIFTVRYGTELAESILERDKAKRKLKVVRARIESDVRSDPGGYGLTKTTEASIASIVELSPEVQEAEDVYLNASHSFNLVLASVEAFRDRKKQLENIVRLSLANYFSDPNLDPEVDKVFEKKNQEKHKEVLKKAMKGKKDGDN